ncbi:MAG: hypothetical protein PHO46_02410 [Thermoguttaceae bacterium]|jgi:hypothetical protein|nr:hypothetical protein [Thermoguttaceae bacterium]
MQKYKIADVVVGVDLKYPRSFEQAQPYRVDDDAAPDVCIELTEEQFERELERGLESREMVEYYLTRFLFQAKLLRFNGLILHSSAVVYENRAYLFSADSGTGKSTHTQLWIKIFGEDNAFILNDDAPALRKIDGQWFAYGTPWSGSSALNANAKVPLQGVGFLERAETCWAKQITPDEAATLFMMQTMTPLGRKTLGNTLDQIIKFLVEVPVFKIGCTMEPDAPRVSYEAMRRARSFEELDGRLN